MGRNQCSQFSVGTAFSEVCTSFLLAIWASFRRPDLGKEGFRPPAGRPGQHFGHQKRDIIFGPLSKQWGASFLPKPPPPETERGDTIFQVFSKGNASHGPLRWEDFAQALGQTTVFPEKGPEPDYKPKT